MRRVRYAVAASLDGYIAGPSGEYDWIIMDPEIDFHEIFAQFDTVLMGRRTFEPPGHSPDVQNQPMFAGLKVFVFSRTLDPRDYPGVAIVRGGAAETVRELREQPGKDIWLFGGGSLFRSLAEHGLVDSVEVAVIPVLLGGGIPLYPPPAGPIQLTLSRQRVYSKSGIVSLEYAVKRAAG